jgi:hypothetical protein
LPCCPLAGLQGKVVLDIAAACHGLETSLAWPKD